MRVLINDHAYEIGCKAFRGVLDIVNKSVPHGIYHLQHMLNYIIPDAIIEQMKGSGRV